MNSAPLRRPEGRQPCRHPIPLTDRNVRPIQRARIWQFRVGARARERVIGAPASGG